MHYCAEQLAGLPHLKLSAAALRAEIRRVPEAAMIDLGELRREAKRLFADVEELADPERWVRLAKVMDATGFDFLFFADTYGYATLEGRMPHEVAAHGIQFPALDPMLAIPALAHATSQLGFVVHFLGPFVKRKET